MFYKSEKKNRPPETTEKLSVQHIMTHPVVVLREVETVGRIMDILANTKHNGYPVVDGFDPQQSKDAETFGLLKGLVLRHQLIIMLKKKCYLDNSKLLRSEDFNEHYPRFIQYEDIKVDDSDKGFEMDLKPYINLAPYSLSENSNFPKVFRLFRGLGLRHIIIVDENNRVVGIVARIDIARYRAHVGFKNTVVSELTVTT